MNNIYNSDSDQQTNVQRRTQTKESQTLKVLDMINSMGLTKARIKWGLQGGSWKIFKRATSQYNAQIEAERQQNMFNKAKHIQWRDWQKYIVDYIKAPINPNEILIVLDKQGNSGNTFIMKYLRILNEENTCKINNCQIRNIMNIISKKPLLENIIVNLIRTTHRTINYEILKQLKKGEIVSNNYDGMEIGICRMIIFTDKPLKWKSLNVDRLNIMTIQENKVFKVENYIQYTNMGGD